jgi:hypothetical protein
MLELVYAQCIPGKKNLTSNTIVLGKYFVNFIKTYQNNMIKSLKIFISENELMG